MVLKIQFLATAFTSVTENFFGNLFSYSKRIVHLPPEVQVSYGGSREDFFHKLAMKSKIQHPWIYIYISLWQSDKFDQLVISHLPLLVNQHLESLWHGDCQLWKLRMPMSHIHMSLMTFTSLGREVMSLLALSFISCMTSSWVPQPVKDAELLLWLLEEGLLLWKGVPYWRKRGWSF